MPPMLSYNGPVFEHIENSDYIIDTLILPDTVKEIKNSALSNAHIAEIILPDGLETIEDSAFAYNGYLTNITIPNRVTSLGSSVFSECAYLESVVIGDGLTEIPQGTFSNCSNLKTVEIGAKVQTFDSNISAYADIINVDANNAHYRSVNGCLLEMGTDGSSLTVVWAGGNFTGIPETATAVGANVFNGNTGITGALVIPDSVVTIGENAFSGCTGITSIVLGDGVVKIGNTAFKDCSNVQSLHIGKSVQNLVDLSNSNGGDYNANAFYGLTSLTEITVSEESENYKQGQNCVLTNEDAGATLVLGCKTSVIPDTVTKIGGYAFAGKGLASLPSLKNITEVGENAFDHNESVSGGVLDLRNVTSIGASAFQFCGSVDSVIVNKDVKSLAGNAFANITIGSVYFCGSADEWTEFVATFAGTTNNDVLLYHQNVIYYSADGAKPDSEHTYWHYGTDDLPEIIQ